MTVRAEWEAIGWMVESSLDIARFGMSIDAKVNSGAKEVNKRLKAALGEIRDACRSFLAHRRSEMPPEAAQLLDVFTKETLDAELWNESPMESMAIIAARLSGIKGRIAFLLSGHEPELRTRTERAVEHLRRLIASSGVVRNEWQAAFGQDEPACERLGAVHLLSHGLFAFKVDAFKGGRTDLVFGSAIDEDTVSRASNGLVLTEWKIVGDGDQPEDKVREAMSQCGSYSSRALAGIELRSVRYIILVSRRELPTIANHTVDEVVYRHLNISVEPSTPSVLARRQNT